MAEVGHQEERGRDEERVPRGDDRGASPPRRENGEGRKDRNGPTCSLLVRNLTYNIRPEDIRTTFSRFGDIRDVYIPTDFYSKKPRGFAFVEFFDKRDASAALDNLEHHEIDGREISVVFAKDRRKSAEEMRPARRGDSRGRGGRRDSRDRGGRRGSPSRSRSRDRRDRRSPPRRRDSSPPPYRRGSPPRGGRSPPRRRESSPPGRGSPRRGGSPEYRRGGSPPPPPRRHGSPSRSPSA